MSQDVCALSSAGRSDGRDADGQLTIYVTGRDWRGGNLNERVRPVLILTT